MTASIIGFVVVLVLCMVRVPIAFSMGIVGFVGFGLEISWSPAFALVAQVFFDTGLDYGLSVVPLFVMMGVFVAHAGLSDDLFNASNAFLGHRRGGLAMASVVACGGFGAICGSSIATVATMARVAMPSMRRFGYDDRLAAGSIAAGGTLGILIPPSIVLIIYGLLTETSIGKLFAAGFLPGVVAIFCYTMAVQWVTARNPKLGPPAKRTDWRGRLVALRDVWGVLLLFLVVIGGIYAGVFTPTEAAGIGAAASFLFALFRGRLTVNKTIELLIDSAYITAVLFVVLIGALIFANFINTAGLPSKLQEFVGQPRCGADHRGLGNRRHLHRTRRGVRDPVDDLADRAGAFSGRRKFGIGPGVVRHHRRVHGRDQPDHAARRPQHICPARCPARCFDRHHLPGRAALLRGRFHPPRHPHPHSVAIAGVAQADLRLAAN